MAEVVPVLVPQVNVNDETVLLARWRVADGATVASGDVVCDLETTKAASEVTAETGGVLVHAAAEDARVPVGATIAVVAATREAAEAYLAAGTHAALPVAGRGATPRATALAGQLGISLDAVRAAGVHGTIKEADVRRFAAEAAPALPAGLAKHLVREGPLPAFDAAVAATLRRSTAHLILTSVDMDCRLTAVHDVIRAAQAAGRMVSLLHVVIAAVARALPAFPRLTSFAWEGSLYRHAALDVAFVARSADGRLFTPVVRAASTVSVDAIARDAQALTMKALRGMASADEFEGAAFTISQVPVPGTTRVAALPSFGQSAILGVSAERTLIDWEDGAPVARPVVTLTLTYDHALCDGVYAANFLAALVKDLEGRTA